MDLKLTVTAGPADAASEAHPRGTAFVGGLCSEVAGENAFGQPAPARSMVFTDISRCHERLGMPVPMPLAKCRVHCLALGPVDPYRSDGHARGADRGTAVGTSRTGGATVPGLRRRRRPSWRFLVCDRSGSGLLTAIGWPTAKYRGDERVGRSLLR